MPSSPRNHDNASSSDGNREGGGKKKKASDAVSLRSGGCANSSFQWGEDHPILARMYTTTVK
jgi:hypothetical protein